MKTITVTFQISEEFVLNALRSAGRDFNLELKQDLNIEDFVQEFSSDVNSFMQNQLEEFLEDGLNQDLYLDCFEEREDDED